MSFDELFFRASEWNRTTIRALQEPCNDHYTTPAFGNKCKDWKTLLFDNV